MVLGGGRTQVILSSLEFLRIHPVWDDLESQRNHDEPEPILFSLVLFCEV